MRTLNLAFVMLIVATSACSKKEGNKAAEPAKSGAMAKPSDKPAEPAAGGGGGSSCADLKTKVCDGLDAAKCGAWFDAEISKDEMNEGKQLSASDQAMACKMILGDAQSLDGYKSQAKAKSQ